MSRPLPESLAFRQISGHQRRKTAALFPDALHLLQILRRGVDSTAVQGAVPLQQPVGRLVGVPPGNGIEEQQLQRLVVGKAVQPAGEKPHGASSPGVRRARPIKRPPPPACRQTRPPMCGRRSGYC
jgi:hypothetical protein